MSKRISSCKVSQSVVACDDSIWVRQADMIIDRLPEQTSLIIAPAMGFIQAWKEVSAASIKWALCHSTLYARPVLCMTSAPEPFWMI